MGPQKQRTFLCCGQRDKLPAEEGSEDALSLAVKMEEGVRSQGMWAPLAAGKRRETDCPPGPPVGESCCPADMTYKTTRW